MSGDRFDVYADESPTEVHAGDCDDVPESDHTGDATTEVLHDPEHYAASGETIDVSCRCLDDVLDPSRRGPEVGDVVLREPGPAGLDRPRTGLVVAVGDHSVEIDLDGGGTERAGFDDVEIVAETDGGESQ